MARMKSLGVDPADDRALRYGRYQFFGTSVASEFYQVMPFFFNREKWPFPIVGHYRGWSAFLICSGPSFAAMDHSLLRKPGVWTMTTNNAVASFRANAAVIVDSPSRFVMSLWMDPTIMKFVPYDLVESGLWDNRTMVYADGRREEKWEPSKFRVGDCPNVYGFVRNEKFSAARWLYEDSINWGNHKDHGGSRSVMMAALRILFLLGFRRVYLLGADFDMSKDKKYSFDEERHKGAINCNMSTYEAMRGYYRELQPYFLAENYVVKNCTPGSKLDVFPTCTLEEAVQEATECLGDVAHERTRGMYTEYDEKLRAYQESQKAKGVVPVEPPVHRGSLSRPGEEPTRKDKKPVAPPVPSAAPAKPLPAFPGLPPGVPKPPFDVQIPKEFQKEFRVPEGIKAPQGFRLPPGATSVPIPKERPAMQSLATPKPPEIPPQLIQTTVSMNAEDPSHEHPTPSRRPGAPPQELLAKLMQARKEEMQRVAAAAAALVPAGQEEADEDPEDEDRGRED